MDIEEMCSQKDPSETDHEKSYRAELRSAYERYRGLPLVNLLDLWRSAQNMLRTRLPTHELVASCEVLFELVREADAMIAESDKERA